MKLNKKASTLSKPTFTQAKAFAEAAGGAVGGLNELSKAGVAEPKQIAPTGSKSGLVPRGDVRLTANVDSDVHMKLKIQAARERTTVGQLIENWVNSWET